MALLCAVALRLSVKPVFYQNGQKIELLFFGTEADSQAQICWKETADRKHQKTRGNN